MIWNRYLLKEFLFCFCSLLLCFNFLYVLIDYASHSDWFYFNNQFHWKNFISYYASDLLHRFTAVAPFLLLLSTIKVVSQLILSNELLAMMASGIQVKKLLRPLLAVAIAILSLSYINLEFFDPAAIQTLDTLSEAHKSQTKVPTAQQLTLDDDSILLFKKYDPSRHLFLDVYWIRHIGDIYHIKTLDHENSVPEGTFVDHFERNAQGELTQTSSAKQLAFPNMLLNLEGLHEIITLPEDQSLSELWKKLPKEKHLYKDLEAQTLAAFYNKMITPWLCLLAVIAPIPFCLNFSRRVPLFAIYACCLFGLVAFTILLNSAFLLGKRQVLDPFLATSLPFLTVFSYFGWRYLKTSG